jgi:hypothetical protein
MTREMSIAVIANFFIGSRQEGSGHGLRKRGYCGC